MKKENLNIFLRPSRGKLYSGLFLNYLFDIFCFHLRVRHFRPLITNFYVTKRCNLHCRYCHPPGTEPDLDTSAALCLLEKIRPHNPVINFTGGEPLLCKDIELLLHKAKELRFYPILLSTNGLLLNRIIKKLYLLDHLVISLDSLNEDVNDSLLRAKGTTKEVIKNIKKCAFLSHDNGFHLSIHSVITPETLESIEDIVSFCESLDITLSVSPEHHHYYPNPALFENRKYVNLVDRLTELKKIGKPIACSYGYLRKIRYFSKHRCYPFVSPRVEPDGRVYFPCQQIRRKYVYLQNYRSLYELMQKNSEWKAEADCSHRCFLACYVDVEQYIDSPFSIMKEIPLKQWVFGRKRNLDMTLEEKKYYQ
jgi:MoaA/NifB/PqqE/SkfB family radical SAM enzyme